MEETIERIVSFFRHAAQGLEERKQILYLLGPVGGGKSSLAERLKQLMEVNPIYVLKAGDDLSPVFESPLNLFDPLAMGPLLLEEYGIPTRRLSGLMSPWCLKRLDEFDGDISRFRVVKIQPSRLRQIAIAKTEPGDENNQDVSSLVGKVDIRKRNGRLSRPTRIMKPSSTASASSRFPIASASRRSRKSTRNREIIEVVDRQPLPGRPLRTTGGE